MKQEKGEAVSGNPTIHRFPAEHEGAFVNAYLVETKSGVVAIDGLLTVSAAREMRAALDRLGKPLHAVLLTHSHPDHYAGLAEIVGGADVPIVAPQGVIDTITADDAMKDQIVGPFFGDDWPTNRTFPNTPISDGERLTFDDVSFTVIDLGPSESPHDSPWVLGDDERVVFLGDQIYDHKHCYLADGFHAEWRTRWAGHVGLATPLHRDVPRCRRRCRLVRAGVGEVDGRDADEGLRAVRRAAVPDGAQRRARGRETGIAFGVGLRRSSTCVRSQRARGSGRRAWRHARGDHTSEHTTRTPSDDMRTSSNDNSCSFTPRLGAWRRCMHRSQRSRRW
jgi:glyoxylase-like metal-dependent hydrolase (beta-lactamase superfamily II)